MILCNQTMRTLSLFLLQISALFVFSISIPAQQPEEIQVVPYPGDKEPDYWLLAGQSNMAGYAFIEEDVEPDNRILFFSYDRDTQQNEWAIMKNPVEPMFYPHGKPHGWMPDYTRIPVGGVGMHLFFFKHILQYVDKPMAVIGVATGRSMEKVWNPDLTAQGNSFIYGDMIKRIKQAGAYGKLKGMVWYQGESDAVEFPSDSLLYQNNLIKFVTSIRKDTGCPDLPFIHVQISRLVTNVKPGLPGKSSGGEEYPDIHKTYTESWDRVREAQRQLADKLPGVYMVSAVDLYPLVDPIHLGFAAYKRLGPRLAEVALSQVYKLPGHGTPIKLESVKIVPTIEPKTGQTVPNIATIKVRFSGVTGKLHSPGQPSGFTMVFPEMTDEIAKGTFPVIFATEFDPKDPSAVLLHSTGPIAKVLAPAHLYYGQGLNPYCNIGDEKDIPIPAFGPIEIPLE